MAINNRSETETDYEHKFLQSSAWEFIEWIAETQPELIDAFNSKRKHEQKG